jgi:hypothetical protein
MSRTVTVPVNLCIKSVNPRLVIDNSLNNMWKKSQFHKQKKNYLDLYKSEVEVEKTHMKIKANFLLKDED